MITPETISLVRQLVTHPEWDDAMLSRNEAEMEMVLRDCVPDGMSDKHYQLLHRVSTAITAALK